MESYPLNLSKEEFGPKANDIITSIIVPCFNEINTIETVIRAIKNSPIANKEIIIID